MPIESKNEREALLKLVREAVQKDHELREKFLVGDKFRFIRDRLKALQTRIEESLLQLQQEETESTTQLGENEELVYVYLYNAQGMMLQTWQKMLRPKVFYEYSINRPIYDDKSSIESFIRNKPNKSQHGYLTIAIKKGDVLSGGAEAKDALGNKIIRVREGALHANRFFGFTHSGHEYVLNDAGEVVRKNKE